MVVAAASQAGGPPSRCQRSLPLALSGYFSGVVVLTFGRSSTFSWFCPPGVPASGLSSSGRASPLSFTISLLSILIVAGPAGSRGAAGCARIPERRVAVRVGLSVAVIRQLTLTGDDA